MPPTKTIRKKSNSAVGGRKSAPAPAPAPGPSKGFFKSLGEGLKSAGATAEKYARLGISTAEGEKLRFELKTAYARLGEAVVKCWDAAPKIGVTADDPAIKETLAAVNEMRRFIRENEIRRETLRKQ